MSFHPRAFARRFLPAAVRGKLRALAARGSASGRTQTAQGGDIAAAAAPELLSAQYREKAIACLKAGRLPDAGIAFRFSAALAPGGSAELLLEAGAVAVAQPGRRLRIGYVSRDFFNRDSLNLTFRGPLSVSRDLYEVFLYSLGAQGAGGAASAADSTVRDVNGQSCEAVAQAIAADRIDILVDLVSHGMPEYQRVFELRPAPVQMSWIGLGLSAARRGYDYIVSDRTLTPPGCEALYTEKIIYLPRPAMYFETRIDAPGASVPPDSLAHGEPVRQEASAWGGLTEK